MSICIECGSEFKQIRSSQRFCSYPSNCDDIYEAKITVLHSANNKKFAPIVDALPHSNYAVDFQMHRLKAQFENYASDYGSFEYNPDFQRGHVWSLNKQIDFIEAIVRNVIPKSLMTITLNCPEFDDSYKGDGDISGFCIIDGLQRVTAIQDFVDGKFKIFDDRFGYNDFDLSVYSFKRHTVRLQVYTFKNKADLLKYYIAINSGGVVHSNDEINRVKEMLKEYNS